MAHRSFFKGVVLGAVVSSAILASTAAFAGTGIGAVFNLGKGNAVNATTTLQGSSSKTLQLTNSGAGPAVGLHVATGQAPLSTNSSTEVKNLNSALVDGQSASDFVPTSDDVSMPAPDIHFGSSRDFDVGPYVTFVASCDDTGGVSHLAVSILNNAPSLGSWSSLDIVNQNTNPATAEAHWADGVGSGLEAKVTQTYDPATEKLTGSSDFANVIWQDGTGETVTATYLAISFGNYCSFQGSAIRST